MTAFTTSTLNYPQLANTPIKRVRTTRDPLTSDRFNYILGDEWLNTSTFEWFKLSGLTATAAKWLPLSGTNVPTTFTGNSGPGAVPAANILQIIGGTGATTTASGNTVTIDVSMSSLNYTNVDSGMSPYTVLVSDNYISVDCSGGIVTLNFPDAPASKQTWTIKDRTGNAFTNNITLTTAGGSDNFDGATSYVMTTNFQAVNLIANATPAYEVF